MLPLTESNYVYSLVYFWYYIDWPLFEALLRKYWNFYYRCDIVNEWTATRNSNNFLFLSCFFAQPTWLNFYWKISINSHWQILFSRCDYHFFFRVVINITTQMLLQPCRFNIIKTSNDIVTTNTSVQFFVFIFLFVTDSAITS